MAKCGIALSRKLVVINLRNCFNAVVGIAIKNDIPQGTANFLFSFARQIH